MSENHATRDQLAADFRRVMEDIDALIGAGGTKVEGEVKAIRDRLRERLEDTAAGSATCTTKASRAPGVPRATPTSTCTSIRGRRSVWALPSACCWAC